MSRQAKSRKHRRGWSHPGPQFRAPPAVRLACTGFLIWWAAVVLAVVLDTREGIVLARLGVLTGLLLALVIPQLRRAVVATPLSLRVNNGWRERRLRWEDVDGFRLRATATGAAVAAVLRSGEEVNLAATRSWLWPPRRRRGRRVVARQQRLAGYQAQVA